MNGNISLSEGPYLILSAGSFNPTTGGVSNGIASFPNNTLRWEKTKTTNVGVDFDVFDNRLGVSLDYYYKKSTDILAPDSTDPTTGTNRMTKNLGAIDNRGIEISLHGTPVRTRDFSWDMIFNMSLNKTRCANIMSTANIRQAGLTTRRYMLPAIRCSASSVSVMPVSTTRVSVRSTHPTALSSWLPTVTSTM